MLELREKFSYFTHAGLAVARKHLNGFTIKPTPTFEKEGLQIFLSAIKQSRIYLEFGSGGSTIAASRYVTKLVSVETDRLFAEAVRRALPQSDAEIHLLTPNIGITCDWGYPVFARPTRGRQARWKLLPNAPWDLLGSDIPDMILIDGRMRVACALESLLHVTTQTRLLIDDYIGRRYEVIERFAELVALHGRMAEFRKRTEFDAAKCREELEVAYWDLH
jgi:hypothetical protein